MSDSWITREKKNIYIYIHIYARPPKKIHLWLVVSQHLPTLWGVKNHGTLWCFCFPQLQLHFLKKDSDISGPHLRTMICCEQFSFLVVMAACIKPQVLEGSKDHKWLIYSWKLTWLSGKSPFSIGNTSTHSWRIFQPVMLVNFGGVHWAFSPGWGDDPTSGGECLLKQTTEKLPILTKKHPQWSWNKTMKDKKTFQCVNFGSFIHNSQNVGFYPIRTLRILEKQGPPWSLPANPSNIPTLASSVPSNSWAKYLFHFLHIPGRKRFPELRGIQVFWLWGFLEKFWGNPPKTQMKEHKRKIKNNSYSKKSGRFLLLLPTKKNGHEFVWALETTEQGTFRFFHEVST